MMNGFFTRNFVALYREPRRGEKIKAMQNSDNYEADPFSQTQLMRSAQMLGGLSQAREKNIKTL